MQGLFWHLRLSVSGRKASSDCTNLRLGFLSWSSSGICDRFSSLHAAGRKKGDIVIVFKKVLVWKVSRQNPPLWFTVLRSDQLTRLSRHDCMQAALRRFFALFDCLCCEYSVLACYFVLIERRFANRFNVSDDVGTLANRWNWPLKLAFAIAGNSWSYSLSERHLGLVWLLLHTWLVESRLNLGYRVLWYLRENLRLCNFTICCLALKFLKLLLKCLVLHE